MLLAALASAAPADLLAQVVRVTAQEENFRLEPRGTKLATLLRGAELRLVGSDGPWRQVILEGWIWTPSVSSTTRDGFDLRVSRGGGENLRVAPRPDARRLAVLLEGCLLERLGSEGNWTRVRRTAWVWAASVASAETATATGETRPGGRPGGGAAGDVGEAGDAPARAGATGRPSPERVAVGETPVRLHSAPEGDTLGVLRAGTDLEVLARRGSWARVRVDGWVWLPSTVPADSAVGERPSAADLRADPDHWVGQSVRWRVKVYSLEQAEAIRTDFYEGEPFLLAQAPDPSHGLVYLAVPPELLEAARQIRPLQEVDVLARVRTGRSALMHTPILDLLAVY